MSAIDTNRGSTLPDSLATAWNDSLMSLPVKERTLQAGTWLFRATFREPRAVELPPMSFFGIDPNSSFGLFFEHHGVTGMGVKTNCLTYEKSKFSYTETRGFDGVMHVYKTNTPLLLLVKGLGETTIPPPKPHDGMCCGAWTAGDEVQIGAPQTVLTWITTYSVRTYWTRGGNYVTPLRNLADPTIKTNLARLYRHTRPPHANEDGITHMVMYGRDAATSAWLVNEIIPQNTGTGRGTQVSMFVEPYGSVLQYLLTTMANLDAIGIVSFVDSDRAPGHVRQTPTSEVVPIDVMYPQITRMRPMILGLQGEPTNFSTCSREFLASHAVMSIALGWEDRGIWLATHRKCATGKRALLSAIELFNSAASLP